MNSHLSNQQDPTESTSADAAMHELKNVLQSAIVPLAGVWVAAGKALISGTSEGLASAKPLETWSDLKNAAKEVIEPLVGTIAVEPERAAQRRSSKSATDGGGTGRGSRRAEAGNTGHTTAAKRTGASAKKRSVAARAGVRAPRTKASS
jgi:hypothetical protein